MFEISWSELLILGLVTLLVVGPKDLPRFLRMLGRQLGVVRRHANEFRAVFDQAMREAELDTIQDEVRKIGEGVKGSLDEATRSVDHAKAAMRVDLNTNRAVQPPASPAGPSESPAEDAANAKPAADAPGAASSADDAAPITVEPHAGEIEADKIKSAG